MWRLSASKPRPSGESPLGACNLAGIVHDTIHRNANPSGTRAECYRRLGQSLASQKSKKKMRRPTRSPRKKSLGHFSLSRWSSREAQDTPGRAVPAEGSAEVFLCLSGLERQRMLCFTIGGVIPLASWSLRHGVWWRGRGIGCLPAPPFRGYARFGNLAAGGQSPQRASAVGSQKGQPTARGHGLTLGLPAA